MGLLAQARAEADRLRETGTKNSYDLRMIAWVYLDCIKSDAHSLPEALPYLRHVLELSLDTTDTVLWEQLYWRLAKHLFKLLAPLSPPELIIWKDCWVRMSKVPGQAYSVLLKALLSQAAQWPNLPDWLDAWGWENLQPDDLVAETSPSGKAFPALAERAYIATAKAFLNDPLEDDGRRYRTFLSQLDDFSTANPQMIYLLYYRVQLRLKIDQLTDALHILRPFARLRQRDFWVWDLLADLHPQQPELQLACYAKALTCQVKPEFLVKLRQKFARLLVERGRWEEAKAEIQEVLRVRTSQQWRIPMEVLNWVHSPEYNQVRPKANTADGYTQVAIFAGELLYEPNSRVLGVVTRVNEQKQTAQFLVSEEVSGGFGYTLFGFKPSVGDCLVLYLEQRTASDGTVFQKVLHTQPTDQEDTPLLRAFEGTYKRAGKVGFVGSALVEDSLGSSLKEDQIYRVMAFKSFNARRQTWGWKAFRLLHSGT